MRSIYGNRVNGDKLNFLPKIPLNAALFFVMNMTDMTVYLNFFA